MQWPDLRRRYRGVEYMDELLDRGAEIRVAARELVAVNRLLGGYRALRQVLRPYLNKRARPTVRILDLGSGLADVPANLVQWASAKGADVRVTAVEGNPAIIGEGRAYLDRALPPPLRNNVKLVAADAWEMVSASERFDVVTCGLFLHHMSDEDAATLLAKMNAVATDGVVVVDLHRHWFAYGAITAIGKLLRASHIFRHDARVSVRRGFRRSELLRIAEAAGLGAVRVRWHWAFRWTLTNLK